MSMTQENQHLPVNTLVELNGYLFMHVKKEIGPGYWNESTTQLGVPKCDDKELELIRNHISKILETQGVSIKNAYDEVHMPRNGWEHNFRINTEKINVITCSLNEFVMKNLTLETPHLLLYRYGELLYFKMISYKDFYNCNY